MHIYLQQEKKKSIDVLESPSKKIRKDKNQEGIEKVERLQTVKSKIVLPPQPEPELVKTQQLEKTREIEQPPVRKRRSPRLNNDVTDDKQHSNIGTGTYYIKILWRFNILKLFLFF